MSFMERIDSTAVTLSYYFILYLSKTNYLITPKNMERRYLLPF